MHVRFSDILVDYRAAIELIDLMLRDGDITPDEREAARAAVVAKTREIIGVDVEATP